MLHHEIKKQRLQRKMTQEALAKKTGLSLPTITKLESGSNTNPTLKTLEKLAKTLAVPVIELLRRTPSQHK